MIVQCYSQSPKQPIKPVANLAWFPQQEEIIKLINLGDSPALNLHRLARAIRIDTLLQELQDREFAILPRINTRHQEKLLKHLP